MHPCIDSSQYMLSASRTMLFASSIGGMVRGGRRRSHEPKFWRMRLRKRAIDEKILKPSSVIHLCTHVGMYVHVCMHACMHASAARGPDDPRVANGCAGARNRRLTAESVIEALKLGHEQVHQIPDDRRVPGGEGEGEGGGEGEGEGER